MDCINCSSALSGRKQRFCSDKCRMAYNRDNKTPEDAPGSSKPEQTIPEHHAKPEQTEPEQANPNKPELSGIDHYYAHPDLYIKRLEPERLNWGEPMTMAELASAGLKCNRVSIPGDWDYAGVCQE